MSDTKAPAQAANAEHFSAEKIYLKDASLEAQDSIMTFLGARDENQSASLEYSIESAQLSNDTYEVVLNMKVMAKNEMRTIFLIEIKQAGIFIIRNAKSPKRFNRLLNVHCPRMLVEADRPDGNAEPLPRCRVLAQ